MPKVIDKYKRFVADEKEMSAYNERDTFLYGQAAMLQYERGRKKRRYRNSFSARYRERYRENQNIYGYKYEER